MTSVGWELETTSLLIPAVPTSAVERGEERRREKKTPYPISSKKGRLAQHPWHGWQALWAPGIRVGWVKWHLASRPLQQKPEDRKEDRLMIFWDAGGVTCSQVTIPCLEASVVNAYLQSWGPEWSALWLPGPEPQRWFLSNCWSVQGCLWGAVIYTEPGSRATDKPVSNPNFIKCWSLNLCLFSPSAK